MPHASPFTDRFTRASRQIAWPLALSLTLHAAVFLGWYSPRFYLSMGQRSDPIRARLTPAPKLLPAPAAPPENQPPEVRAEPPEIPEPVPVPQQAVTPPQEADSSAYLPSAALDAPPVPLANIEPGFPDDAGALQAEGRVELRVLINERGAVDRVIVEDDGSLPAQFADSAATAFLAARFSPARRAGVAVRSQIRVEVSFGPVQQKAPVSPARGGLAAA